MAWSFNGRENYPYLFRDTLLIFLRGDKLLIERDDPGERQRVCAVRLRGRRTGPDLAR